MAPEQRTAVSHANAPVVPRLATPAGLLRHSFRAMGTEVTVLLPVAHRAWVADVVTLFERWEESLSRFRPASELSQLNAAAGREVMVSQLLFEVTSAALAAARATRGRFDPALLHPMRALGYDRSFELLQSSGSDPRPDAGSTATAEGTKWRAGCWEEIRLDPVLRSITLPADCGLDLGGIAKGMAVDAAVALLAFDHLTPVAVEAGGDLAVHGNLPGGDWPVTVEAGASVQLVTIRAGALATSTIGRRRWVAGGEERHHLLDPGTQRPAETDAWSVTVAAETCREAEVAAKTAVLLGIRNGAAFLREHGLAGLLATRDGEVTWVGTSA